MKQDKKPHARGARKHDPVGWVLGRLFRISDRKFTDAFYDAGTVGLHVVVGTFVGFAAGHYLDKWLGTKPYLTLILLVMGVVAGFRNVWQDAKRLQKQYEKPDQDTHDPLD